MRTAASLGLSATPERPYDAAGWTLPMQMGVNVVAAASPLGADVRASLKQLGPSPDVKVKPTPYPGAAQDAARWASSRGANYPNNDQATESWGS